MNSRTAFVFAALAAGAYILYKSRRRRLHAQKRKREAVANWENEGGAPASSGASPA
jgi:hypothetical protein